MALKLPEVIRKYVGASNEHDLKSIAACFSEDALVRDEAAEYRGKKNIEEWIGQTITKYKFHFKPLSVKEYNNEKIVVGIQVSGNFDGSPVNLDFHFTIVTDQILTLSVEQPI
jgi:ketosteroid isomerase-like protein